MNLDIETLLVNAHDPKQSRQNSNVDKTKQTSESKRNKDKPKVKVCDSLLNEEIFLKLLKDTYEKNQKKSFAYKKLMLSPTDLCQQCPRKIYFRMQDADYDIISFYPYSEVITHVGNAIHEWTQQLLSKAYKNVESEIKFELEDLGLKGFIDLVYETNDNQVVILEIKTCGDELHDPMFYGKTSHWKQVATYYWIWTEYLKKPCSSVQLMYLKRDFKPIKLPNGQKSLPFKIFTADPTKLWNTYKDDILWMYNTIRSSLKDNKVPDIPNTRLQIIKKEECGFCPYQKICSKYPFESQLKQTDIIIENLF